MAIKPNNNEKLAHLIKTFGTKNTADRGVQAAQREFYDLLVDELDRHVLKRVKFNEDVAQAAMQNAWMRIFMTAHTYDPRLAAVSTWAKKIGDQCAVDELRKVYAHKARIVDIDAQRDEDGAELAGLDGFSCTLPGPDEQIQASQVQQAIAECIERLPAGTGDGPNFRLAMKLTLDDDLTYKEMKDILSAQSPRYQNLNAEQVRGWVRQAAAKMKGCINEKLGRLDKGGTQ